MFRLVVFCTLAVAIHCGVTAPPKKVVVQKTFMDNVFQELTNIRTDVEHSITSILPDTQNATKLLLVISKEFADSVVGTTKYIKQQAKNAQGVIDNGIKEFTTKLENSAKELRHLTDTAVQKTNQITTIIDTQVKSIFDEVQEALQNNLLYAHDNIKRYADKFFNDLIAAGKAFQLNLSSCQDKPKK